MEELENKKKYNGVGGWLFILCFTLIFVSPIRTVLSIYTIYLETNIYFKQIKGIENYMYIKSISSVILMIISVWSGISLVLIKPYAVKTTKIFLTLFIIYEYVQNLFPAFVGFDTNMIKEMNASMSINIPAVVISCIWLMYLNSSERVKNTFPNLSNKKNIENQKDIDIAKALKPTTNKFKFDFNNQIITRMKNIDLKNLGSDEIVISSIIIGTLFGIILGYAFGETAHFWENGVRVTMGSYYVYSEYQFNYLLGISGFIITSGITYLFLKRKNMKSN